MEDQTCELTAGEKLIGITFNPGENPEVNKIKRHYANVIDDLLEVEKTLDNQIAKDFIEEAIKQAIIAQMMAVKAITFKA